MVVRYPGKGEFLLCNFSIGNKIASVAAGCTQCTQKNKAESHNEWLSAFCNSFS
jgi:hypothetical protein